jgi:hypothetical protein
MKDTVLTQLIKQIADTLAYVQPNSEYYKGQIDMLETLKEVAIEMLPHEREQIEEFGSIVINNAVKRINKDPDGINADELFDKHFTQYAEPINKGE